MAERVPDLPRGVAVLGAGAIGSLIAARLLRGKVPVTLVDSPEVAQTIREQGLVYERPLRPTVVLRDLEAVSRWEELDRTEVANIGLVISTARGGDTATAIASLDRHVPPEVPLLLLQEGIGGTEGARDHADGRPLLAGAVTLAARQPGPGVVCGMGGRGGLAVASVTASEPLLHWAAGLLAGSGLRTRVYRDHRAMAWSSLVLGLPGNAVPAIVGLPPQQVLADAAFCRLEIAALREALAVMRALSITPVGLPGFPVPAMAWGVTRLPLNILRRLLPRLVRGRGEQDRSSLRIELEGGALETGVEYLNGAVVRAGLALGVPVPANALIYRTLTAMAQGTIPRDAYTRNPYGLLAPTR
ncbi:MAG: hypothetical protein K6V36_13545 [Anaerolineae bacterium]|nr:hypothetical protein [Anaerolineae bacterium]